MSNENSVKVSGTLTEVLKIAFPLVLAALGHAINLFTDRVMLNRYAQEAMAAAFPAGLTSFALSCFFLGTVGYTSSFVAQYSGAKLPERVGTAVWQGIFLALTGGIFMALSGIWAPEIFAWFGHEAHLQILEVRYYRIVGCLTVIFLLSAALSCFWSGRGKTLMVMMVNLLVVVCNIPFNYLLIYGNSFSIGGVSVTIPEMGITGAAWGTVCAGSVGMLIYAANFFAPRNARKYGVFKKIIDPELFKRMLRFGSPNGMQMFLDLTAFNAFVVVLGKISPDVLAASGVAFSINALAFTPMIGMGQSVAILTGQAVGAKDIPAAERAVRSALILVWIYMGIMGTMFIVYPDPVFHIFALEPGRVLELTRTMIKFIAGYLLFDGLFIVYSSAVKGAGDTKFAMWVGVILAWFAYALPCAAVYFYFHSAAAVEKFGIAKAKDICLWTMWTICVLYIISCGTIFFIRYKLGAWKKMRVIEEV